MPNCPRCGKQLSYLQRYGYWYCFTCQKYFQVEQTAQPAQQPQQGTQPYPYQYQQPPPMQYAPPSDKSILPIIAVVLVIVIIIAFAAAFFFLWYLESGKIETSGTTPTLSMYWHEDQEEPGNYTGNVVSISGVTVINTDDVTVTVSHAGSSGSKDLDTFSATSTLRVPASGTDQLELEFRDLEPLNQLTATDQWIIINGDTGDTIRLIYKLTSGQMYSTTLI